MFDRADLLAALHNEGYQVKAIHNLPQHFSAEVRKWEDVEKDPNTPYHLMMFRKDRELEIKKPLL